MISRNQTTGSPAVNAPGIPQPRLNATSLHNTQALPCSSATPSAPPPERIVQIDLDAPDDVSTVHLEDFIPVDFSSPRHLTQEEIDNLQKCSFDHFALMMHIGKASAQHGLNHHELPTFREEQQSKNKKASREIFTSHVDKLEKLGLVSHDLHYQRVSLTAEGKNLYAALLNANFHHPLPHAISGETLTR